MFSPHMKYGVRGAEWVASCCATYAVRSATYSTKTFVRGKNQSLNTCILNGDHSMPYLPGKQWQERWTSLSGGVVEDTTWDKEAWAQWWLQSIPEVEWPLILEYDPDFRTTHPQVPPARGRAFRSYPGKW
jgi:hypothetical protein